MPSTASIHIRLVPAGVRPPVPRVEDEDVGTEPRAAGGDGVELEHPADGLLDDVHEVGAPVVGHRHPVVLRPDTRTLAGVRCGPGDRRSASELLAGSAAAVRAALRRRSSPTVYVAGAPYRTDRHACTKLQSVGAGAADTGGCERWSSTAAVGEKYLCWSASAAATKLCAAGLEQRMRRHCCRAVARR